MLLRFFENVGTQTFSFFSFLIEFVSFSLTSLFSLLSFRSYNSTVRRFFVFYFYNTTIKSIPFFLTVGVFFGFSLVGTIIIIADKFGLELQTGEIIISGVIKESAPLISTLFLTLRLNAKLTLKVASLEKLQERRAFVVATLWSSIISTLFFSIAISVVMLLSGYIFTLFYLGMNFHTYSSLIVNALAPTAIYTLLAKGFVYGFVSILLPLVSGFKLQSKDISASLVLQTVMRLFLVLFFMEVVFMLLRSF